MCVCLVWFFLMWTLSLKPVMYLTYSPYSPMLVCYRCIRSLLQPSMHIWSAFAAGGLAGQSSLGMLQYLTISGHWFTYCWGPGTDKRPEGQVSIPSRFDLQP